MAQSSPINFNVISQAFDIVKEKWQPFVIAGLFCAVAIGVASGAMFTFLMALGIIGGNRPIALLLFLPIFALFMILLFVLTAVFQAGLFNMGLKAARGETIEAADVFAILKTPVPFLVAGLIIGLGVSIGSIFCYLPGLIFAGLTMFTFPFMIDKKMAPADAIKASIDLLKSNWLMATLFYLVVTLVSSLGVYACYVGLFFTYPVAMVAMALSYLEMTGSRTTESPKAEGSETL